MITTGFMTTAVEMAMVLLILFLPHRDTSNHILQLGKLHANGKPPIF
jgi:hypothetical protein